MDILVVGRGWTGSKVFDRFVEKGLTPTLVSHQESFNAIRNKSWDWVVNCAGVTGVPNVDACELDKRGTVEGNAVFPILLHELCEEHKVRLAHFSSGCIYTGHISDIDADPNFFGSIYSVSKGISDIYLKDKAVVFRIRMPFTGKDEAKNYLTKVKKYADTAKLYDSGPNSLSDHDESVAVACDLVLSNTRNGPYNLVNQGTVTMRELAAMMKLDCEWFTEDEFQRATRAGRSTCVIPAFESMRPLDEALAQALKL